LSTRWNSIRALLIGIGCASIALSANVADASDIQDLVRIKGHEKNVVTGLGIVIGLNGTGDRSKDSYAAARPMAALLKNFNAGLASLEELAKADAYAIVQVTMEIPATGAREGDELDVSVESLFNAKSLEGGRLVPSLLRLPLPDSANLPVMAMAQGKINVQGDNPRSAVIRGGGQVLEDLAFRTNPVTAHGTLTLVLREQYAGYPVATVIAEAINDEYVPQGYPEIAAVEDAKNIRILLPEPERPNPASFIATIMSLEIDPAMIRTPARIVVNEEIGSIVVTGTVEISPAAITHGGLSITTITPPPLATQDDPVFTTTGWAAMDTTARDTRASARLSDLIAAFEQLNIPPADRIAILYQLKEAGALHAEIIRQ